MYVSLKDVATRAGVSFQTASKVLTGRSIVVSAATRQRIETAADDLGYVPNALARGLAGQSSLTIGVLADDFHDWALAQFVMAAHRWAAVQGQGALTVNVQPGVDPAVSVRILREHRVSGVLVVAPSLEADPRLGAALRGSLPAVSLHRIHGGGVPMVGSDHRATGAAAAEHLLGLGHRRIATVTGPSDRRVVASRLRGFRDSLRQAAVPLPRHRVAESDWTAAGGFATGRRLLAADPELTAIFAHNDLIAVGVHQALHERGLRVPQDCSLVGCDDLPFTPYLAPPLTTIRIPFQETGERAAALLTKRISGEEIPRLELLPTSLVVRGSTGPPPEHRRPPEHRPPSEHRRPPGPATAAPALHRPNGKRGRA